MDHHAFASLAHVRVLLLPVGSISRTTFDKWASEIRTFENMRLSDVPPGTRDEKARFMPSPKSKGFLHLSFPSHPPPASHLDMSLFRPSHFPLGIIGIASCSHTDSLSSILADFNAAMTNLFPAESMFPLARSCFVFEEGDGTTNLNLGDLLPGLVIIPSMMGNKKENIETLLADLCSNILGEFSTVLQTLESPLGNEYLNATMFPFLPSASDMPQPLDDEPEALNTLPPLPSYNSQPELGAGATPWAYSLSISSIDSYGSFCPQKTIKRNWCRFVPWEVIQSSRRLFFCWREGLKMPLSEAIALFKLPQDTVWQASALEGLAIVSMLDAWASGQGLQASFSNSREPWSEIAEKLNQAIALYSKIAPSPDSEQHLEILAYLYSIAVLRQSSLFFATWSAKGWGPLAFTAMLHPGPMPYIPPTLAYSEYNTSANRDRLSSISGITPSQISVLLAQAHGPWLLHIGHRERIIILEEIASMYSSLGYRRKEAYILREVIGCILDLMVCGREEAGELNLVMALASAVSATQDKGAVAVKENERSDGNESILKLVKYVCNVHGINLEAVKMVDTSLTHDNDGSSEATKSGLGPDDGLDDVREDPFGWPELQVGIVREALAVAEALPDIEIDSSATAQFSLSALKCLHAVLSEEDQYHFYTTSARALATARRRGDKRIIDYWSGRPIDSIELLPPPPAKVLVESPISILAPRLSQGASILTRISDPFLYNPRKSLALQGRTLVVKGEVLEFLVTLRNPYVFDLEIQALTLSTSGVPFESKSTAVIIPSNSYHSVSMSGKPLKTGILAIRGCFAQAPGGASHEFILPLSTTEEEDRNSRRRSIIECESGRSKYHGLDSRPWEKADRRTSVQIKVVKTSTKPHFMECKVVPEQPLLRIRWSSLTHGAVMLYNGEKSTIRLTLENVSSLPIDFLRLTFDDSTIPPAQHVLAEGELSVFDTYETEYELISRPVFSWSSDQEKLNISPHRKVTIVITCLGKVGCTSGTIHMSYGYVHRKQETLQQPPDVFHTRRLSYPVLVTVYHMLECHKMDIGPFRPGIYSADDEDEPRNEPGRARKALLRVSEEDGWCLFSIDVRNTYGLPFEVTFERVQEGAPYASTTCSVAPGSTSRIIIPIRKFLLQEAVATKSIPTLSDRQFVVAKSNLTTSEEAAQRELFWYREELFKYVRGRWREAGGTRSGELSLRQQRMSLPMLENLRTETARVHMSLVRRDDSDDDAWKAVSTKDGKYYPEPHEYVYLLTKVTNLSLAPLVFTLDVLADPSDYLIQEGIVLDIPVGRLSSGDSREVETALCFVSCGRFELTAEVRILGASREEGKVGFGQLTALVHDE
ncbi:hypothetical protein EW146_g4275 [Bondarzewia mesenterica]|uniref:Hypercellular protein HypA n=1 Tax=Bondarzewia mesenterica TaxID=1095465 RepID=A0A4S4LW55_9AGAM|nr:hypothetical protein EW146_g4275 [Bondarzewia mesenterica]